MISGRLLRAAVLAVNLAAAEMAARQIRLRNLAGAIVIDFVSMARRGDRERVGAALQQALADDPAQPQILGWTRLGHLELTRRRRHKPLAEILFERPADGAPVKSALTTALEALRAAARQAAHFPARAPALIVHPAVAAALAGPAASGRRELEASLARKVAIVSDPAPLERVGHPLSADRGGASRRADARPRAPIYALLGQNVRNSRFLRPLRSSERRKPGAEK